MNGQGKLLTHFLKNADKLVIPVYQRNYDWKEEHCKKLYSDLCGKQSEIISGGIFLEELSLSVIPWAAVQIIL